MKPGLNHRPTPTLARLALAVLLAGCGGSDETTSESNARHGDEARVLATSAVVAPLLDDEGNVYLSGSAAVPADTGAHTRSARYATAAQAAQVERALGEQAIAVTVEPGPDAAAAVEMSTLIVFGLQAARNLPSDAVVLVRGPDLRLAAALANRLEEQGLSRVFLVNAHQASEVDDGSLR